MSGTQHPDMSGQRCDQFVELVTDYLDDALPDEQRARIQEHLDACEGCRNVLAQWRTVISLSGELTEADVEDIDPLVEERLYSTFLRLRRR